MLEDSGEKTEGFLGFGGGRSMSKLEWLMLSIARSFTLPPSVLVGMAAAIPLMIGSGVAMLSIAHGIKKIQQLKINYDVFPDQVDKLVTTLATAFGKIGKKYPGGGGGILRALIGSSSGDSAVSQGISAVMGMGRALGSIANGVQNMANLAFPIAWDKNGNPIKFRQLTETDFVNLGNNTQLIVNTLTDTFAKIGNDPSIGKGGRKGFFQRLTGGGSQSPVADGISSVMGMGEAIGSIATGVQNMANLSFPIAWDKNGNPIKFRTLEKQDFTNLTNNTVLIVDSLTEVFGKIGNDDALGKGGRKGFFQRLTGSGSQSPVADGISAVMGMGEALGSIATGVQSMANLSFPIYKNGEIVGYEPIGDIKDIKTKLTNNTATLIEALTEVFGKIGKSPDAANSWGWFGKSNIEKGVKIVESFGNPIKSLAMVAESFGDKNFNADAIKTNIQTLISTFTDKVGSLGQDKYEGIGSMWNLIGVSFERIGDSMPKISNAVNSMDIKKLTETRLMFDALARLAENDGENAMTVLADKLMKAVAQLSIVVENLEGAIEQQGGNTNSLSDAIGGAISSLTDKVLGAKEEVSKISASTGTGDMSDVVAALQDIEDLLANGILVAPAANTSWPNN
jgi:hypothetical protein